jgi:Pregnancy-associated plasma protein-A
MGPKRKCGAQEVHNRLLKEYPAYIANRRAIETHTLAWERIRMSVGISSRIITIAVVVHVVYQTSEQNISDDQILSQIKILNEDYRKRNSDLNLVPPAFKTVVADSKIEFKLACRDPVGKPTKGIIRKKTRTKQFTTNDRVKSSTTGGSNPWAPDMYLNLWVCKLGGGLLGYAQFPGGPQKTDGVVITYTAFGDSGTAKPPFDKGRTATHEIGHWLDCYHIWGDDTHLPNPCSGSDNVSDTPNQEGPNYGCPTFPHVTCKNGPNGDMFMNYMDYTDDACMHMFTRGQVSRMEATLNGPRSSLLHSDALNCVSAPTPKIAKADVMLFDGANKYVSASELGIMNK